MRVGFLGMTHLGKTLTEASRIRGCEIEDGGELDTCDLVLVTEDVDDHRELGGIDNLMGWAVQVPDEIPLVLVSQVPPGYTRQWSAKRDNLFYQVDSIIMHSALKRATLPGRIVVGCRDARRDLPKAYAEYLALFECPVIKISYESAELVKLAVNYFLAKQIETTNDLSRIAKLVGAWWPDMVPALRLDGRLGAYLEPGEVGGHLPRDVRTIERLLEEAACMMHSSSVATAK